MIKLSTFFYSALSFHQQAKIKEKKKKIKERILNYF